MSRTSTFAAVVLLMCVAAVHAGVPVVTIADGKLQGKLSGDVLEYLGIPFAAPPINTMRWRAPGPVKPWSGVRDATQYQPNCAQPSEDGGLYGETSEDCLYLNVYAPASPSKQGPLPVAFWIYGGSFVHGGASLPLYDGQFPVALANDVIIVTVNYRLGAFGFMGSPALANRTDNGSFGVYGLLDQRAGMKWVQANIGAFGGDPTRVTIYGESAGGGSVSSHLVMPGSAGLFRQAMMESGPMAPWVGMTIDDGEVRFQQVLASTGCSTVACLETVTTAQLITATASIKPRMIPNRYGVGQWSPVVDGVELPGKPSHLAAAGKIASKVPTLMGTNRNEGRLFAGPRNVTEEDVERLVAFQFGLENAEKLAALYPLSNYDSPWQQVAAVLTDSLFACPTRATTRWMLAAGAPVSFVYQFNHAPYWLDSTQPWLGCAHTAELPFVWDFPYLLHGPEEQTLATQMATYWMNFVTTGTPNAPGMAQWPQYSAATDVVMNLNVTLGTITHLKEDVCDFWNNIRFPSVFRL